MRLRRRPVFDVEAIFDIAVGVEVAAAGPGLTERGDGDLQVIDLRGYVPGQRVGRQEAHAAAAAVAGPRHLSGRARLDGQQELAELTAAEGLGDDAVRVLAGRAEFDAR